MVLLLVITTIFTFNWGGDFWEHATVVQAFSQDLWTIKNPVINSPIMHTFQTPYHWFLGLITQLTGLNSFLVLRIMGAVNVAFLLLSFNLFIKALFPLDASKTIIFYALYFVLFTTGIEWRWSSFLDIYSLIISSCYPSVLANALLFLGAFFWLKYQDKKALKDFFISALILALALSIHPLTAVSAYSFIISASFVQFMNKKTTALFQIKATFSLIVLSVLIALIFPYFQLIYLISKVDLSVHILNLYLYKLALKTMPPILFLMAIIYFYKGHKKDNKIAFQIVYLSIFIFLLLYFYGFFLQKYSYGRVISQVCIFTQILAGFILAKTEEKIAEPKYKLLITGFLSVFLLTNSHLLKELMSVLKPKNTANFEYNQLQFLRKFTAKNDVILSDKETCFILPAFSGKVVYSDFLIVSLNKELDIKQRENDVDLFFNQALSDSIRLNIIQQNAVNFILLKKQDIKPELMQFCQQKTQLMYEDNLWILFKTNTQNLRGFFIK
jgi:hypothetical protein